MAKIGLNSFRYSVLTEATDGTPSYDGANTPAKAVSVPFRFQITMSSSMRTMLLQKAIHHFRAVL